MSRGIKKRYKKYRIAFKHELKTILKNNKTLKHFILEIYASEHNKNCIDDIYDWLSVRYPNAYEELIKYDICAIGNTYGVWRAFKHDYPEFTKRYMDKIPLSKAMGDALAVLINSDRQEDKEDKNV